MSSKRTCGVLFDDMNEGPTAGNWTGRGGDEQAAAADGGGSDDKDGTGLAILALVIGGLGLVAGGVGLGMTLGRKPQQ